MANGVLSSYFETDRAKAAKKAGGIAGYGSAPTEDAGGAPAGGAPAPAPSGPKPPTTTGGSGFMGFGQYFGANAPAVQAQAQKAVEKAKGASQTSLNAPMGASGLGSFRPASFGPMPSAQMMMQRQTDPFAKQIAQTEKQSEGLEQAARYGDMGEGVSAFDQMLGGGLTQRAAKQEQQRLGALRAALEGEQAQYQKEQERQAMAARSREDSRRRQEERAAQDAADVERAKDLAYNKMAGWVEKLGHSRDSYWNSLSEEEKQAVMNSVAQERGYDQYGPEYASATGK